MRLWTGFSHPRMRSSGRLLWTH